MIKNDDMRQNRRNEMAMIQTAYAMAHCSIHRKEHINTYEEINAVTYYVKD